MTGRSGNIETARRVLKLEAEALGALARALDAEFDRAIECIFPSAGGRRLDQNCRVICVGIGKSGHVARKISATLASTGTPSQFLHPAEASHGDLGMIIRSRDVILALSKSGDTPELGDVLVYARHFKNKIIAMTAEESSALAKAADIVLLLPRANEACGATNAPTTSTTMMMALGDALAVALLERRGFGADDFRIFHPRGKLGAMLLRAGDIMNRDRLPIAAAGASLKDGLAEISAKGWGCVGVVDGARRLVGIVTDGDVRRLLASGAKAERVGDAMTTSPVTTTPDALAAKVLHVMNERKITQIFVVENGAPVGIIHMHDLIRAGLA